jgi:predicted DNA-binding protein
MPVSKDKTSIGTVVPLALKMRIERIANEKKWTLSQTVKECLETFIEQWEKELGLDVKPSTSKVSKRSGRKKTES